MILKRDRYASLRSLPSSMYFLYDCLLLLLPFSFSYFLLFSHSPSLPLYTWPLVLPLRSAALPLYHYPSFPLFVVQWTRAYSAVDDSVNSYRKGVYTYSYVRREIVYVCLTQITRRISRFESRRNPLGLPLPDLMRRPTTRFILFLINFVLCFCWGAF